MKNERKLRGIGARAPEFTLPILGDGETSLAESIHVKPVVLAFFKVSCPVCQMAFPFFQRLSSSATHQFLGISQDDATATRKFNTQFGIQFPVLLDLKDRGYPVSNGFGVSLVPTAFLVEQNGEISWMMDVFAKTQMKELGSRVGVEPFLASDRVPDWKPG